MTAPALDERLRGFKVVGGKFLSREELERVTAILARARRRVAAERVMSDAARSAEGRTVDQGPPRG